MRLQPQTSTCSSCGFGPNARMSVFELGQTRAHPKRYGQHNRSTEDDCYTMYFNGSSKAGKSTDPALEKNTNYKGV